MATHTPPVPTGPNSQGIQPAKSQPNAPGRGAWIALGMLCLVYVLNFLSRQLPSILAKPIQDNLHVSDGQLGRMSGLYFALFYCCISIPVGWFADKTNRSRVLAAACAIWSVATMCCGLTATCVQFVFAYMVVGFGEAGGVPPSYSIISDYFPPAAGERRSVCTTSVRRSDRRWESRSAHPSPRHSVGAMRFCFSAPWACSR